MLCEQHSVALQVKAKNTMYACQWRVQIQPVFLWGVSKVCCGEMLLSAHSMPAQHPSELTELTLL